VHLQRHLYKLLPRAARGGRAGRLQSPSALRRISVHRASILSRCCGKLVLTM
jgi:hypothetical protein